MTHSEPRGTKLSASYFLTYFAVLLIPLIAALICYTESSRTIQTDIENENRALIRQAADILDMQLRELNDFGAQMVSNPTLTSLRYVDSPLEYPNIQYYFRMQSALPAQATLSSFLFDYFLFFNRGELALNDRFAYSYNDFYSLYMHSPGQTLEEWKQEVASVPLSSNTCSVRQIIYLNGDSNREMRLIEFTFSFLPFNSRDGQIVLYVDQQKFTDILASFRLENGDIAYIESAEKQVLASFGADDRAAELQGFLDGQSQNVDLIRAKVTGNRMLISRYRSAETGVGIAIARSADRAYARLYKVRWIIAGSLLIAVLLGMLFSFLFSLRNSAFIARLSPQLRGMSYGKAFQSLRKSFEDIRIANSTMERALASQQPYLQKSYLTQLLNGDFSNEENALAIARNIPSFKPKSPMRVVLLHFSGDSAFSGDTMDLQLSVNCKQVIRLAVESLEPDIQRMSRSESDYVLLLCGEETEQRIERLVRLIRENLPGSINEFLYVYVGNAVEKLTDVVRSWENASSMIYIQPSPTEVSVQYYKVNEISRSDLFYPQDIERRLINSVMNADDSSTQQILKELKQQNTQGGMIPPYLAQLLIDGLLNTLLKINSMAGLSKERSDSVISGVKSVMTLPTNSQLDMVHTLYSSLCATVFQMKNEGGKQQVIDEISAYIQEHYMEPDLSLTGVADQFHVSESYLSFSFKAQKGTNFFSFVEGLRISQAKVLLLQTNLKISEIAERVGYASANSFCRAFKRSTGDSASSYRNSADGEEKENKN